MLETRNEWEKPVCLCAVASFIHIWQKCQIPINSSIQQTHSPFALCKKTKKKYASCFSQYFCIIPFMFYSTWAVDTQCACVRACLRFRFTSFKSHQWFHLSRYCRRRHLGGNRLLYNGVLWQRWLRSQSEHVGVESTLRTHTIFRFHCNMKSEIYKFRAMEQGGTYEQQHKHTL